MLSTLLIATALALANCQDLSTLRDPRTEDGKAFDPSYIGSCSDVHKCTKPQAAGEKLEGLPCWNGENKFQQIGYSTLNKHEHDPSKSPLFLERTAWLQAGWQSKQDKQGLIQLTSSFYLDSDAPVAENPRLYGDTDPKGEWHGCALFFTELARGVSFPGGKGASHSHDECSAALNE